MNIVLNNNLIESYFKLLDTASKKQLITRLIESIDEPSIDSQDFSVCFGAWDDERNAQEIFDDIRSDRVNVIDVEDF
jgi:hypothetical protein